MKLYIPTDEELENAILEAKPLQQALENVIQKALFAFNDTCHNVERAILNTFGYPLEHGLVINSYPNKREYVTTAGYTLAIVEHKHVDRTLTLTVKLSPEVKEAYEKIYEQR